MSHHPLIIILVPHTLQSFLIDVILQYLPKWIHILEHFDYFPALSYLQPQILNSLLPNFILPYSVSSSNSSSKRSLTSQWSFDSYPLRSFYLLLGTCCLHNLCWPWSQKMNCHNFWSCSSPACSVLVLTILFSLFFFTLTLLFSLVLTLTILFNLFFFTLTLFNLFFLMLFFFNLFF